VEFLGHVISHDGVRPSPDKASAGATWRAPKTLKPLQSFLGFVNFYRRFIPNFAQISVPLTKLLAKDAAYYRTTKCQGAAFDTLRDFLLCEPLIKHFYPSLPTRVERDSSGYAIGAVLAQEHKDGWHPVAFLSQTMTSHERNYPIHEQELLALIYALKKWRHYLFGMEITAYTDHSSVATWETNRELSGRKARWHELLCEFPVKII
jgi:hypothetical protein